jgi:peptide/nickel transport system ATP-binding protein
MHGRRTLMEGIPGSPPDLRDLPSGCAFHPRCQWAIDKCKQAIPHLEPINGSSREVACWLHHDDAKVPAELAKPDPLAAGRGRVQTLSQVSKK